MVVWIIGLSGSGKTTIAELMHNEFLKKNLSTVLIDGDQIRELFSNDLGYSKEDRLKNAGRIKSLCKLLDNNKINVICAILSISEKDRQWCRKNLSAYKEIYIDASIHDISIRGYRDLYNNYDKGKVKNVVGKDIKFETPKSSNYIIKNNLSKEKFFKESKIVINSILSEKNEL